MDWKTPVSRVAGIGPSYEEKLLELNIATIGDLLTHPPSRFDDFSKIKTLSTSLEGETITVIGEFLSIKNIFTKFRKTIQKGIFSDGTTAANITWFNQPYLISSIKPHKKVALSGKLEKESGKHSFLNPEIEYFIENNPLLHTGRLVPIYPQTAGVSSKWLRTKMHQLLQTLDINFDWIKEYKSNLLPLSSALINFHFPKTLEDYQIAKKRLAYDELLVQSLVSELRKKSWQNVKSSQLLTITEEQLNNFIQHLPFELTPAQIKAITDIRNDLSQEFLMNRLLQGDVGSGKTAVAAAASFIAVNNGMTVAVMAPTEILAQQHFKTFSEFFKKYPVTVELITSSSKKNSLSPPLSKRGKGGVFIGTHALLEDKYDLGNLGLIIIDEQHRFGVKQRAKLRNKSSAVHTLTMTATPIPRTVMLSLHGDLAVSVLDTMPQGRIPIKTRVVSKNKRQQAYTWIRQKVLEATPHNQVFIVCPFVETSESIKTVKAAKAEYELLQKQFPDLKLGLLHGKMKNNEKDDILNQFRRGEIDILIATPIVEVGIDIPQATIMVIEAAERFGLAQLHQLRGRVGRSDKQSFCLLFTSEDLPDTTQRLAALETTHSGMKLAEIDLKIRGPGSLYGIAQHGSIEFKIAQFEDFEQIPVITQTAVEILRCDPHLLAVPYLKARVESSTISEVSPD